MLVKSDGSNSALSPVVHGDVALSINAPACIYTNKHTNRIDIFFIFTLIEKQLLTKCK